MQPCRLSFEFIGSFCPTKEGRGGNGAGKWGLDGKALAKVSGGSAVLLLAPTVVGFAGLRGGDISRLLWLLKASSAGFPVVWRKEADASCNPKFGCLRRRGVSPSGGWCWGLSRLLHEAVNHRKTNVWHISRQAAFRADRWEMSFCLFAHFFSKIVLLVKLYCTLIMLHQAVKDRMNSTKYKSGVLKIELCFVLHECINVFVNG